ncbi:MULTISPECIES: 1-deoxy-D-xylulose-5-phosphate synthase [Salimicrobium]|uniref:1-deoxy-D-xylulose-5-phosphate synthase n=2 Tax=Salimicrobium TaxID=351195 RepID=K2GDF7_9BACI|nr:MULTISPECIES: 1-deoxy-D-xylulose-5-phosphate synthase [Salimicrobium]AKG04336.1 1-deoxy-D-xylulose-5-phosphate synthase [Salimicrobium jeotgali]EKE32312.1 1-deoxy-D-xylulose-5-phosphate synthase [Salimicrobium jeotgali]MBM7695925.1 1-deoxy-D-xylulose-5-phosphate synthase [Salimicrobium jeotgali]SDX69804.1 1-deoxy-D-xylulose-5-phosphate synthase [Salimicrobium album]
MDLNNIKDPSVVKNLTDEEMRNLAQDVRNFLINNLSETGGHLGANLGVVELTLALHRTFDSPNDRFLFDVGHQSYVHKILTGRGGQFDTLRKYQGLCGFPKRNESEHDVWETGHSSTSLSAAMGMAIARDLKNESHSVVPIIGDGALTGGMALEALNHIGHEKKNVTVILNDNEMSIAKNVGALHSALARMRSAGKYNRVKDDFEWLLKKIPAIGGRVASTAERLKDSMKYFVVPGMFFEELGFTYYGPVDGHDFEDLQGNLDYARKTEGPVIVHVMTQKGKGYQPAESDVKDKWHGVGPYKIDSGEKIKPADAPPAWSEVISEALRAEAREDERIVAVTPAMILGSKLEKFGEEFPDRLYDVGIAEQHATTMSAGLATQGMRPFLAIYSTFLQRGYDQVIHDVARQNLNVIFGIDRAGLVGADGETHQGVFDIAFLRTVPNMSIMMPKDENEAKHMVHTAVKYEDGPIALRYPRGNALGVEVADKPETIDIGSWETLKPGEDAVILTFGTTIPLAIEAAETLQEQGVDVEVVNARFMKPMDEKMLHEIFERNIPVLTLEEAVVQGSFGSAVLEFQSDHSYYNRPLKRIGLPDRFVEHGDVKDLWKEVGLTRENVVDKVLKLLPQSEKRA